MHEAFVAVNEKGTEEAVDRVLSPDDSANDGACPMVKCPFVVVNADFKTGTILFTGRAMDPSVR